MVDKDDKKDTEWKENIKMQNNKQNNKCRKNIEARIERDEAALLHVSVE